MSTAPSPVPGPQSPVPRASARRTLTYRKSDDDREPDKRPLDIGLITRLLTRISSAMPVQFASPGSTAPMRKMSLVSTFWPTRGIADCSAPST